MVRILKLTNMLNKKIKIINSHPRRLTKISGVEVETKRLMRLIA